MDKSCWLGFYLDFVTFPEQNHFKNVPQIFFPQLSQNFLKIPIQKVCQNVSHKIQVQTYQVIHFHE